jgi:hypothetical protein
MGSGGFGRSRNKDVLGVITQETSELCEITAFAAEC